MQTNAQSPSASPISDLPSLPRAAIKIIEMAQDPDVDLQKLGKAIELDPALATKLVRLSNSSLFGLSREVVSVHQALVILGLRTVKMAALSFTLLESFPKGKEGRLLADIWRRVLINANGCRLLAGLFSIDPEEAFLAGMLQDIGMLLLARTHSDAYLHLFERAANGDEGDLVHLEKELYQIDHAEMGARVLDSWNLPKPLVEAIRGHHCVDLAIALPEGRAGVEVLMSVVECITNFLMNPTIPNLESFNAVSECFGESASEIDKFVQRLEIQVQELAELLDLDIGMEEGFESILKRAREGVEGTRINDRAALPLRLGQELAMARRQRWDVSVVLVKLVCPKSDAADAGPARQRLFNQLGVEVQARTRECDSIFRLSDDVYCILAPNTPEEGVCRLVDRQRSAVSGVLTEASVPGGKPTVTFAAVTVRTSDELVDGETILRQAVENLSRSVQPNGLVATVA